MKAVTNPQLLANLVLVRVLRNTAIARLAGFDIGFLATSLATDLAGTAAEMGKDVAQRTTETLKKILPVGE